MKCPYQIGMDCPYVDSAIITSNKVCTECEYYERGIKPSPGCLSPAFGVVVMCVIGILILILL